MDNPVSVSGEPSQDDRIMAALAHVSIVVPYAGLVVPAIVWITQKNKSRFIAFQALQAVAYQVTIMLAGFAAMVCYMASFFLVFASIPMSRETGGPASSPPFFFAFAPFLFFGVVMIGGLILIVYAIVAAVMVLMGRDFRYIILGGLLERYVRRPESGV